jgi:hypothetical protein
MPSTRRCCASGWATTRCSRICAGRCSARERTTPAQARVREGCAEGSPISGREFWPGSGYALLGRTADGRLALSDDYLRHQLARPELAPLPASGPRERALHAALVAAPRGSVDAAALAAVEDPDARENFAVWLRFRDRLLAAPSLEAAYAGLFAGAGVDVPPLFVQELTQVILRHILGDAADPLEARAGEMLFRQQKISVLPDGAVMAADDATVERYASGEAFGSLGELLARNRTPRRTVDLDVLTPDNAEVYWERSECFDLAVSLNRGQPALAALCRVLERWIRHFHGVETTITPLRAIDDAHWSWHVGLDSEATALLNDLYQDVPVDDARRGRLLCLFRLEFAEPAVMRPALAGRPVWLGMAMDAASRLRLKPQNLLLNLPLARLQ